MSRRLIALAAVAAAFALAVAPGAAQAGGGFGVSGGPKSFQIGGGDHPAVAVDPSGTAHVAWNQQSASFEIPDIVHYCHVPHGADSCTGGRTFSPPLEAIGRTTYVFAPSPNRVLIETYRCCGEGTGNYVIESTDGGQTFGTPRLIGNIDHQQAAVFGPGEAISGSTISTFQQMPLTGAPATAHAEFEAGFPIPTHSGLGLFGGTTPVQVMSDGSHTSFVRNNGGNANSSGSWTAATPLTPVGDEPVLASGPAGVVLLYNVGEAGSGLTLAARKFDGTSFGAPVNVSEKGDPIFFDLSADPVTGTFHAVWIANASSPNELRWSFSSDGLSWSKPQIVLAGDEQDNTFNLRVSGGPEGDGFAVWDENGQNGAVHGVRLVPGVNGGAGGSGSGAATTPAATATVSGTQLTLLAPGGCVNPGTPLKLRVTSKTKKKLSPKKRVKIVQVLFSLDKKKVKDKKAAFKATFSTAGFAAPSTHKAAAKVQLKPVVGKGKKKTKTLKGKIAICG
jgi:hypothetical protein